MNQLLPAKAKGKGTAIFLKNQVLKRTKCKKYVINKIQHYGNT
jgi:hypothetical protein